MAEVPFRIPGYWVDGPGTNELGLPNRRYVPGFETVIFLEEYTGLGLLASHLDAMEIDDVQPT